MHKNIPITSIHAYHAHMSSGRGRRQCGRILDCMRRHGGDWSIGELAAELDMQKNAVSARIAEMLHQTGELVACPRRKDRVSGITIRPVTIAPDAHEEGVY